MAARREDFVVSEPDAPCCPHCGGRELTHAGRQNGKRLFKCRACGRGSYGETQRNPYPCPYCKGRCVRAGIATNGSQRYLCRGCGRKNTGLYPDTPRSPGGPFRHPVTFYLNSAALRNFGAYCNARGMSVPQAARAVLWNVARQTSAIATTRRIFDPNTNDIRVEITGYSTPLAISLVPLGKVHLPDVQRETARKRMRESGGDRRAHTVGVVAKYTVWMDDEAMRGLLRLMEAQKLNHQEAMRYLLAHVYPPEK